MAEFNLFQRNSRLQGAPFSAFARTNSDNTITLQFKIGDEIVGEAQIDRANGIVTGINGKEFNQFLLFNVHKLFPIIRGKILIIYLCQGASIGAELINTPGAGGVYYFEVCGVFYA